MYTITIGKTDYHFGFTVDETIELVDSGFNFWVMSAGKVGSDIDKILAFYDIILKSYVKLDKKGNMLPKTWQDVAKFQQSKAFRVIWTMLATDDEQSDRFMKSIVPTDDDIKKYNKRHQKIIV